MFHYDFIAGNAIAFAKDPFSIILTESKAKSISRCECCWPGYKGRYGELHGAGSYKDNPINSSFQFDVLMQMDGRLNPQTYKNDKSWNNFGYITFLQLQPNANSAAVATKINGLIDRNRTKSNDKVSLTP